jgi:hypothetical protein
MYTGAVKLKLANFNYQRGRPGYFTLNDIELARALAKHIVLNSAQIRALKLPHRRLSHLIKYGFIYHYQLMGASGAPLSSAYTVGRTAFALLGLPLINLNNPAKTQSLLAVNQALIYFMHKAPAAKVDISLHRIVQAIVTINNTFGVMAPRTGFDRAALLSCSLEQGIVILPDRSQASSGLPVRYLFDDEMGNPFDLKFYKHMGLEGLVQEDLFSD